MRRLARLLCFRSRCGAARVSSLFFPQHSSEPTSLDFKLRCCHRRVELERPRLTIRARRPRALRLPVHMHFRPVHAYVRMRTGMIMIACGVMIMAVVSSYKTSGTIDR